MKVTTLATFFSSCQMALAIVDMGLKPHTKTEITLLDLHDPELPKSEGYSVNGFGFLGFGDGFRIGVDQDSGGVMLGSSIIRNSDDNFVEAYARCNLRLFSCKTTRARANIYFQRFENGNTDAFEMQPLVIEEVVEQCDGKIHDGCSISAEIEEYVFNYTLGDVTLVGKGITLDIDKGCATFKSFIDEDSNETMSSDQIMVQLSRLKYYNETICRVSQPYFKRKFTSDDLRDTFDDDRLASLFETILDAERQAQLQHCYFSPCGIVTPGTTKTGTEAPPGGGKASSLKVGNFFILFLISVTRLLHC